MKATAWKRDLGPIKSTPLVRGAKSKDVWTFIFINTVVGAWKVLSRVLVEADTVVALKNWSCYVNSNAPEAVLIVPGAH